MPAAEAVVACRCLSSWHRQSPQALQDNLGRLFLQRDPLHCAASGPTRGVSKLVWLPLRAQCWMPRVLIIITYQRPCSLAPVSTDCIHRLHCIPAHSSQGGPLLDCEGRAERPPPMHQRRAGGCWYWSSGACPLAKPSHALHPQSFLAVPTPASPPPNRRLSSRTPQTATLRRSPSHHCCAGTSTQAQPSRSSSAARPAPCCCAGGGWALQAHRAVPAAATAVMGAQSRQTWVLWTLAWWVHE